MAETTCTPFQSEPDAAPVRLIVRRVKPTPGSQLALFATYSYHGFITDRDGETLELERPPPPCRGRERIRDLKYGVGLNHLPSGRFAANGAWLAKVMAHNLARWTARIGLGEQTATTKTLRRRFFSLAGRLTRSARRLTPSAPALALGNPVHSRPGTAASDSTPRRRPSATDPPSGQPNSPQTRATLVREPSCCVLSPPCPTSPESQGLPAAAEDRHRPHLPEICPDHRLPLPLIAHSAAVTPYLRWIRVKRLIGSLETLRSQWQGRFDQAETVYRELLRSLDSAGVGLEVLSERRKDIQGRIHSLDGIDLKLQSEILPRIQSLMDEREELLTKLQNNRKAINTKREQKAQELSAKLDQQIRLHVRGRANTVAFRRTLQEVTQGAYLTSSDLDSLAVKCHPVSLVKYLLAQEFDSLSLQSGLGSPKLTKVWDTILERDRVKDLYELQLTDVEDVIEVNLQVTQGTYRRLEELSHGQKCMVVLMVALAEGDFPLLVDQPEDALHAPSIEKGIVSTLRSERGTRQCIFATRNANILVSADAEQIIALEADAQNGHVAGTGSLDRFDHRQLVIYHVEGGEQAFSRRKTMYTLEPSL